MKRWLKNFSLFIKHMSRKLVPADSLSRFTNLLSAVGSERNSSVVYEPRFPLPYQVDKINQVLFEQSVDKETLVERAFAVTAPSQQSRAESAPSRANFCVTTSSTLSKIHGSYDSRDRVGLFPRHTGQCIFKKGT